MRVAGKYIGRLFAVGIVVGCTVALLAAGPIAAAQSEQNASQKQAEPDKAKQSGQESTGQAKPSQDQSATKADRPAEKQQPPAEKQNSPEQEPSVPPNSSQGGQGTSPAAPAPQPPAPQAPQQTAPTPAPSTGTPESQPAAPSAGSPNTAGQPNSQPSPSSNAPQGKNGGSRTPRRKIVVREGGTGDANALLAPSMTPEQASRQRENTLHLLASAEANLQRISGRQLNTNQQAMVEQARAYMQQSKEALNRGDLQRGHNLALKASLLSGDLVKH